MQSRRFDDLSREVSTVSTRRDVAKAFAAATVGIVFAAGGLETGSATTRLQRARERCRKKENDPVDTACRTSDGIKCVDLDTDPEHCGSCGNKCGAGKVCKNRVCTLDCQTGTQPCNGQCVDPASYQTDPNNCGGCVGRDGEAEKCPEGDVCFAGICGYRL